MYSIAEGVGYRLSDEIREIWLKNRVKYSINGMRLIIIYLKTNSTKENENKKT